MILFTQQLFLLLSTLAVCYALGYGALRLAKVRLQEKYFALFTALTLGLLMLVSIYALICTRGSTIQSGMLLLVGGLFWALRRELLHMPEEVEPVVGKNWHLVLRLAVMGLATLIVQYGLLYDSTSPYLQTPFQDYVYYSRLTMPLNQMGLETNQLEAVFPQFLTEQPYHYVEVWLDALLVRITGWPSVWVYFMSVAAVMSTIIGVGFMAIFAHFRLNSRWLLVLGFLFLFITGVIWPYSERSVFLSNGSLLSSLMLCLNPKLGPVYLLVQLSILLLLNRRYLSTGFAVGLVPLAFVSTTPVIGLSAAVVAFYLLLRRRASWWKAIGMILPAAFSSFYIAIFYLLQPEAYQFPSTGRAFALQSIIPSASEIRTLVNITVGVFINYSVYFLGYFGLAIGILLARRRLRNVWHMQPVIVLWFGTSLVVAAMMRAFGTHFLDSFQFFSNIMIPLTPVVLAVLLGIALQGASYRPYALSVAVLAGLLLINSLSIGTNNTRYSAEFLQQVSKLAPTLGARGGYLLGDKDYKNAYMLSPDSYTSGNYISNFKNDYAYVSLSALTPDSLTTDPRFSRDSAQAEQIVRKSSFYRFAKFQALRKAAMPLDSAQYYFVRNSGISFICTSRLATLPATLRPLVARSYVDTRSGEALHILNPRLVTPFSGPYKVPVTR